MNRISGINHQIRECKKQLFALGALDSASAEVHEQFRTQLAQFILDDKYDVYNVQSIVKLCSLFFGPTAHTSFQSKGHYVEIKSQMRSPYQEYNTCIIMPPNHQEPGGETLFDITLSAPGIENDVPRVWGKTQLVIFFCLYFQRPI